MLIVALAPLLMGGACEKKKANSDTGVGSALDAVDAKAAPVDKTPIQGFDLKLQGEQADLFYKLVGSVNSPCEKPMSLRQSLAKDPGCKRNPFALRFVAQMIEDELPEKDIREAYRGKYENKPVKLDVSKAPRRGPEDAPIRIVEFFDYKCGHCAQFKPILERVQEANEGKLVTYYMMYPIVHAHSKSAAQAALAANQLGKFKEMHDVLFASPEHDRNAVVALAVALGMDSGKFEAAYAAAEALVGSDYDQGKLAGVKSTPTLFFNDRRYEGPIHPRYIAMWIDEELAVNR